MKRDRDDTDFRAVRAAYEHAEAGCPFCSTGDGMILLQNSLAVVVVRLKGMTSGTRFHFALMSRALQRNGPPTGGDPSDLLKKPLQRGGSGADRRSPTPQVM